MPKAKDPTYRRIARQMESLDDWNGEANAESDDRGRTTHRCRPMLTPPDCGRASNVTTSQHTHHACPNVAQRSVCFP